MSSNRLLQPVNVTNRHNGSDSNITSRKVYDPSSVRSQNILIPQHRRNVSNHLHSQSLMSRRNSVMRGSVERGSIFGPSSFNNKLKRSDPHLLMNIKSPNFKTHNGEEEEEIINSVKENYLNDHFKNKVTGSSSAGNHSLRKDNKYNNDIIDNSDLQRPAGDITRDIYKLASNSNNNNNNNNNDKKIRTLEDIELSSERYRRKSTASGLNVPGGFRREYIVNKIRSERESLVGTSSTRNSSTYGSISAGRASETPFDSDNEGEEDDDDDDDGYEIDNNLEDVPFLTRNFLEFLYIYGHFAGESFEDDFYSDEMDQNLPYDISTLVPITSKSIKAQMSAVKGTASTRKVFLLLLKSFIGTGVLFLPKAFANGGLIFSSLMLIFFGIYSYWCYFILVKAKEMTKVSSFGDIGLSLYGSWLRILILFALGLTQVGFAGAYMIFTGKNLAAFINNVFHQEIDLGMVMLFQLMVFIPISFIRNVSRLSFPALIANFCILFGLIIIIIFFFKHWIIDLNFNAMDDIKYGINNERWPLFIGTAIFAFEGIGLIIPVQESMKHPELFPQVLRSVIMAVTILFIGIGSIGYIVYGSNVETVILLNLPQENIFVNIIQLLYSFAIMLSTPLQLFPAIKIIEDKFFPKFIKIYDDKDPENVSYRSNSGKTDWKIKWWKNVVRSVIVTLVVTYAYFGVDYLDQVVAIVGSFCCLPLVYVIPPMLHLRCYTSGLIFKTDDETVPIKMIIIFDYCLIIFGIISMLYTSYQSIVVS